MATGNGGDRFTGHGSEWTDANLSKEDAHVATVWVDQIVNRRSMLTNKDRVEDVRDVMWELEKDGEILVHRVTDEHKPVTVKTLYGWDKRVPTTQLWHHKFTIGASFLTLPFTRPSKNLHDPPRKAAQASSYITNNNTSHDS